MKNLILYWRIFVVVALTVLFLLKVISQFNFLSFLSGIFIFVGIPWLYTKVTKK
ncbi:hypothetical protein [Bacillus sp. FJAT-29937]|uniref:hypothetical protein n=1 Tax=Bacillus sp. FJAT-29937 TaxID=1720553 RepID=UPI0012E3A1DF|nr:hypothetical protein [Bacillus sp. FJAT-29937]